MATAVMQSAAATSPGRRGHDHQLDGTRYGERCSCCPYGYHIDLDFLRYLDSLYSGESLKSLRRIRHSRSGGLPQAAADGFFSDDELSRWHVTSSSLSPVQSPPPRSASSSSRVTTDEILMEIDTSMSRTLHTIDNDVDTRVIRKKKPPRPLPDGRPVENGYRSAPDERRVERTQELKLYSQTNVELNSSAVTSTEIADKFSGLMSGAQSPVVGDRQSQQVPGTISPEILQAIREQMAVSLQRMRELEDQVRVIPVMEDQISTLRDDNQRLYHLLARFSEDKVARGHRSHGGDSGLQVEADKNVRTFVSEQGSILVELPVKIGQEQQSSYSMVSTETRTDIHERNASARREFFWDTSGADNTARMSPESLRMFKPSRTIGVGDGNVFDGGSMTGVPAWKKTRDVGVHCLPPSRDVSVSVAAAGDEQQPQDEAFGAKVNLTVTVSDERRPCEPRWEVERFGTGLYQSVAIQCLIIGGFLTSDRQHMSENVDGWLVESNKLHTYSPVEDSLTSHAALKNQTDKKQVTTFVDNTSTKDGVVLVQSAGRVDRQLANVSDVLDKLYQAESADNGVMEEKAVVTCVRPSAVDLNASFKKLQENLESGGHLVNEDAIVPQSKPRDSSANKVTGDLNAAFMKLQADAHPGVEEDVVVCQSAAPRSSSSCTFKAGHGLNDVFAKLEDAQTVEEDVIVSQAAERRASSARVKELAMDDLDSKQTVVVKSSLIHEEKVSDKDVGSTGVEDSGVRPFPPHLSRITASSVSDEEALSGSEYHVRHEHDVSTMETTTHSVDVVKAADSSADVSVISQPVSTAGNRQEATALMDHTSQITVESEAAPQIKSAEVMAESSEVVSKTETTQVVLQESVSTVHSTSTTIISEGGGVQQSSDEVGNVCVSEVVPVSPQQVVVTSQQTESTVVSDSSQADVTKESEGEVVHAAEAGHVTVDASVVPDQPQGCHIIITETRVERQLIGCDADQSQPVVIVPEDTVIHTSVLASSDEPVSETVQQPDSSVTGDFSSSDFEHSEVLNEEMLKACVIYAQWLVDASKVTEDDKKSSVELIQKNWFGVSSRKSSTAAEVQSYLLAFEGIQLPLLFAVVNMADADGNTALHYAVSQCNIGVMTLLLDTGVCDVRRQNRAGYTAIMLASLLIIDTDTHRDVVRRLFTVGDVNVKSATSGQTALMLAASHGRYDMVELLLDAGADVNARDEDGSTALMCACEHGYLEIVQLLLSHPACDSSLADVDGSTALSIAMDEGHRDIGVLLYAHMNAGRHSSPSEEAEDSEL